MASPQERPGATRSAASNPLGQALAGRLLDFPQKVGKALGQGLRSVVLISQPSHVALARAAADAKPFLRAE
jgi:hypothetical protein